MEEILASIRRIIADDDTTQGAAQGRRSGAAAAAASVLQRPEPVRPAATCSARRAAAAGPEPAMRQADIDAMLSTLNAAAPPAVRGAAGAGHPRTDRIDGDRRAVTAERQLPHHRRAIRRGVRRAPLRTGARSAAAAHCHVRGRRAALVGDQRRRSIPRSTRSRRPCWCRMPARSRIWCARCCGRCSSPGSTTTCPGLVERLVRAEIERVSRGRT